MDLVRLGRLDPEVVDGPAHGVHVHVGDHHGGARLHQMLHQVVADLPHALDGHPSSAERVLLPRLLGARLEAEEHSPRGDRRRIARSSELGGNTRDIARLPADHVHVVAKGADVLRGDVATPEGLDEPPIGAEQLLGLDALGVADDHGLPASEVETGGGRLVRHPPGQAKDVSQRVLIGWERVEAGATERGSQRGGVDGHDGPQSGRRVVEEHDLLVLIAQLVEDRHRKALVGAARV
jgi:hypothetical protein